MCGIVGVVGNENASNLILDGLKKLEYRGYDSAGIALVENSSFRTIKEEGKIINLQKTIENQNFHSKIGIGHTRWATHGCPSQENAHPHASNKIILVHNGIIENYQEIKEKLQKKGVKFLSQTDSEVVPHLLEFHLENLGNIKDALIATIKEIKGTFAFAILLKDHDDLIIVAKKGSPLVLGLGEGENYVASDYYAIASRTNKIIVLEDGQFGFISSKNIEIFDKQGIEVKKEPKIMEASKNQVSKDGFEHFMLKEIYEQPRVLEETIQTYIDLNNSSIHLTNFAFDLNQINKITIIACGTSYYAGLAAKYLIEDIAKVEVEVDIASEFRYRNHPFRDDNLMVFISQSGETADTLAALKYAKENNQKILSIVNVAISSMAQLSDAVIRTVAGPEIGVASTKAYTAQIATLAIFAIELASKKKIIGKKDKSKLLKDLVLSIPKMVKMLEEKSVNKIKKIAKSLVKSKHLLFIGRGVSQITAFESALKMRELSYIDSQGIAAGELKHGTIALIDKKMPVIVIAPQNELFEKTLSNAQEVDARSGKIIFVSNRKGISQFKKIVKKNVEIPKVSGIIQEALLPVIATQLLAYYVSLFKGNDVDQPRNLAKSVTVE